ncbi:MAG TPA: glycoside hydrolase family 15 protein [Methylibium sp.]|uniref:glycoside hydrolase family 15 protein n=1 Tax=Methylibium sp. TaxID=2067992 RepID=UPI002DBECAEF|nr:glycoside hydrolase family 15 protein [Methylibium sp.]HEU4458901.1 glycoside hydrolase family 15 protein [Methylibium sp.]
MTDVRERAGFEAWLERQLEHSARQMLRSISPVAIVKQRPGFGQTVRPIAGAIVASPVLADWKPDPDYFFHWFRDSAVVVDALRLLHLEGRVGDEALRHLRDFTRFSLALNGLDGRVDAAVRDRRARVAPDFLQYLRDDDDLARAHGDAVAAETRVNPDGTLDVSRWARPQHDGAPLRALAMLRWANSVRLDAALLDEVATLIRFDLGFTLRRWREPSFDIWEEESGHHYYTLRVAAAALAEGAAWLEGRGDAAQARPCRDASQRVFAMLDGFRTEEGEAAHYRSRGLVGEPPSAKALDIAVILSAIHTHGSAPEHGVADPCMQATLARLEALFDAAYPINHGRPAGRGPAMGRYAGDVYFSGGAYYFSTLGAAEFCFRAAALGGSASHGWFDRGDAYLETVRAYTPAGGDLSEQFDQTTGAQTSAKHLAWSYAAFVSCVHARRAAAVPRRR